MNQSQINEQINAKEARINELLSRLSATDYIGIKIAEGAATKTEYANERSQRQQWRAEINELQQDLVGLRSEEPDDEPMGIEEE